MQVEPLHQEWQRLTYDIETTVFPSPQIIREHNFSNYLIALAAALYDRPAFRAKRRRAHVTTACCGSHREVG